MTRKRIIPAAMEVRVDEDEIREALLRYLRDTHPELPWSKLDKSEIAVLRGGIDPDTGPFGPRAIVKLTLKPGVDEFTP